MVSVVSMMSCRRLLRGHLGTGLLLLVSFGLLPTPAVGQVLYGSIVGNVTDETRGALPGATVSIVHNESGATRDTVTDSTGGYRFTAVQSGTYAVTVKIDGFRTFTRRDVAVTLNSVARVDVPLQVGPAQRNRHRVGGTSTAADRSRRSPIRAAGTRPGQPAGIDQPQLPIPLPCASGLHAPGGGTLGAFESLARARVQRERCQPQLQQHSHRRRQHDQRLAAARRGLRARARVARNGQRRHEQFRR